MSQIHRPPRGLQHLLGSQSFGKNPDELAQVVQPTIDITSLYASELLKTAEIQSAVTGTGLIGEITFQAPVAIVGFGVEFNIALGAARDLGFNFRLDGLGGTGVSCVIRQTHVNTYPAGVPPTSGYMMPYPLVVPGGAALSAFLDSNAAFGATTLAFRVIYIDLNAGPDT